MYVVETIGYYEQGQVDKGRRRAPWCFEDVYNYHQEFLQLFSIRTLFDLIW